MKKRVNITLDEHVLEKVDEMAKKRGIDRSTMLSILIWDSYNLIDSVKSYDVSYDQLQRFGTPL